MTIGVHDFEIPHDHVQPTRDMVIIRIPMPPVTVGSMGLIRVPQQFRDLASHSIQVGRILRMGPLAFTYKNGDGVSRQNAREGDWVVIRAYAGTELRGGKIKVNTGYRYVSSFNDIIGILPAEHMPAADTLLWTEDEAQALLEKTARDAGLDPSKLRDNSGSIPSFDFDNTRKPTPMFEGQQKD